MEEIDITRLTHMLELRNKDERIQYPYKDEVTKIIQAISAKQLSGEVVRDILSELYRYTKLGNARVSFNLTGDSSLKASVIVGIQEAIDEGVLSETELKKLRDLNDKCSEYLNPLGLEKEVRDAQMGGHSGIRF